MNPLNTQPSLLSRVRDAGDHDAWREFESKYRELVLRYCRARGLQTTDAEDILQGTLAKMMRTLPGFVYDPSRGRFRDYLLRAVRNAITDHAARLSAAPRPVDMEAADPHPPEADALWEREWEDHHYRLAMGTVRATFEGRSVAVFEQLLRGAPPESIAAAMGMTPAAVHKVKQRVRDRLREIIEEQVREEDRG